MCFIKFMGREVCVAFDTRDGYVLQKTSGYAFVVERKLLCVISSMLFCSNQREVVNCSSNSWFHSEANVKTHTRLAVNSNDCSRSLFLSHMALDFLQLLFSSI